MHTLSVELFGLFQLVPQPQQTKRGNNAQPKTNTPGNTEVILGSNHNHDSGHNRRNHIARINHKIGKEDKPTVSVTGLELTGTLRCSDGSSGIFTTDTNTEEETIGSEGGKETFLAPASTIGTGTQGTEDDEDNGCNEERPFARPVVTQDTKGQLTDDSSYEGNGTDVATGGGVCVCIGIDLTEHGVD